MPHLVTVINFVYLACKLTFHTSLGNSCGTSSQPQANAEAALEQWTRAGMPPSKLLLGLATYGYVSKSKATKLSGSFAPSPDDTPFPPGAHPRDKGAKTFRTVPDAGDLSGMWGQQIAFHQLVRSGVLKRKLDGTYDGANGFTMSIYFSSPCSIKFLNWTIISRLG